MNRKQSLSRAALLNSVAVVFVISVLFTAFFIYQKITEFRKQSEVLDKTYQEYQQDLLADNTNNVMKFIAYEYSLAEGNIKKIEDVSKKKTALDSFQKSIIAKLENINFGRSTKGNIFIFKADGTAIFCSGRESLNGKNLKDFLVGQNKPCDRVIEGADSPGGSFLTCELLNPSTKKAEEIMMHSVTFSPLEWIIASELNMDDFRMAVSENQSRLNIDLCIELVFICIISFLVFAGAFFFTWQFSKSFKKELDLILNYLGQSSSGNCKLSEKQFSYEEFSFIASSAVKMVAEIKQLLQKTKEFAIKTEVNSQAKSTFMDSVSHDFRTSLNVIMGMNHILSESQLNEEQKNCTYSIQTAAQSMLSLINAMSEFSSMQSGSIQMQKESLDVHLIAAGVSEIMKRKSDSKNISIKLSVESILSQYLKGDPKRVKQILITLLGTAINYSAENSQISFTASRKNAGGLMTPLVFEIFFKIKDHSAAEEMDRIFDLSNPDLTGSENRTGAGASFAVMVCKYLADLMNGGIEFQPSTDDSVIISFFMPVESAGEKRVSLPAVSQNTIDELKKRSGELHVLLVEDDPINQKIEFNFISKLNCKTDCASNGLEAVKLFKEKSYDMIFMDCQMPLMDGYEAAEKIRCVEKEKNLPIRIPIIALTADASANDLIHARESGMDEHLAKPVTTVDIENIINKYFRSPAL